MSDNIANPNNDEQTSRRVSSVNRSREGKPRLQDLKREKSESPLRPLVKKVVCPHCWHKFSPENAVWIAESPELVGDFRIGEDGAQRFLPTVFDFYGNAVDAKGSVCRKVACPHCHLQIPQTELEMSNFFISIVGAPASGKSYFLGSMTMVLRRMFPQYFQMNFLDAEPHMNQILQEYEELLFFNENDTTVVKINKTEEQGELYDTVFIDGRPMTFPSPFIFSLMPFEGHIAAAEKSGMGINICLYDNAGESYLPTQDADKLTSPVTGHLARSNCIFFLFDPLQDIRFQQACRNVSDDPQLFQQTGKRRVRQETVLTEMINRIRIHRNMHITDKYPHQLFVIVTKADAWAPLLEKGVSLEDEPLEKVKIKDQAGKTLMKTYAVCEDKIERMSTAVRALLAREVPEIISTIEQFAPDVKYIPVSATGSSPIVDAESNTLGFRSKDINPKWIEVPVLYALAKLRQGFGCMVNRDK